MSLPHHYTFRRLSRKNMLRSWLYPFLMPLWSRNEAWARHWEWMADQGYEDGYRQLHGLRPRWMKEGRDLFIAGRFRQGTDKRQRPLLRVTERRRPRGDTSLDNPPA